MDLVGIPVPAFDVHGVVRERVEMLFDISPARCEKGTEGHRSTMKIETLSSASRRKTRRSFL